MPTGNCYPIAADQAVALFGNLRDPLLDMPVVTKPPRTEESPRATSAEIIPGLPDRWRAIANGYALHIKYFAVILPQI
jgi:hypothetical protein